jgi:hypothetical protein
MLFRMVCSWSPIELKIFHGGDTKGCEVQSGLDAMRLLSLFSDHAVVLVMAFLRTGSASWIAGGPSWPPGFLTRLELCRARLMTRGNCVRGGC